MVSIDYRLKLKGLKLKPIRDRAVFMEAVDAAVEDLISATAFIIENAEELNIDPDNIVTMGSSAGAMTVLSADYELCNRTEMVSSLPAGFRFKGVIPFAGALFRDDGRPSYKENPAPTLFLHGKDDKVVPYKGFSLFRYSLWGSDKLAGLFAKKGYPYCLHYILLQVRVLSFSPYLILFHQLYKCGRKPLIRYCHGGSGLFADGMSQFLFGPIDAYGDVPIIAHILKMFPGVV